MESALFFDLPHFLAANRIHFAGKCFEHLLRGLAGKVLHRDSLR
jgi:hypothetical protein